MAKFVKNEYGHRLRCFDKGLNNDAHVYYLNVDFKKGLTIPSEDFEGEFILKTSDGVEHNCFFTCYEKKDKTIAPKLIIIS